MIETSVLRELRGALIKKDPERTGLLPWEEVEAVLQAANVKLGEESVILAKQFFASESGVRYQELLQNLRASLNESGRAWRVYKPTYTFESRNLRESEANTMVRKSSFTPTPLAPQTPSVISQLQSDRVDYLTLGLARETFQRLDRNMTGRLSPSLFEQCFRSRHISPMSRRLICEQSKDAEGQVEFAKFNQLIEKYKYAPVKNRRVLNRRDTEESVKLSMEKKSEESSRMTANLQRVSAKLKEKFSSSLKAFRAFRRGEGLGLEQFATEMANLGLCFSAEECKELFEYLSQGSSHLTFDNIHSAFEATAPCVRPLPHLSSTPSHSPAPSKPLPQSPYFPLKKLSLETSYVDMNRMNVSPLRRRVKKPLRKQSHPLYM